MINEEIIKQRIDMYKVVLNDSLETHKSLLVKLNEINQTILNYEVDIKVRQRIIEELESLLSPQNEIQKG
jgi:hypothetical protein